MANYFYINGYWKDDKSQFENYIVKSSDDIDFNDENIFFYGLSENEIKESINDVNTIFEFVITSYSKIN